MANDLREPQLQNARILFFRRLRAASAVLGTSPLDLQVEVERAVGVTVDRATGEQLATMAALLKQRAVMRLLRPHHAFETPRSLTS